MYLSPAHFFSRSGFFLRKEEYPCDRAIRRLAFAACFGLGMLSSNAEFVPNVVSIDLRGRKVSDPEFDSQDHQITWQDDRLLWVAEIDPSSGDIAFQDAQFIATNCVPMFPVMEGTSNAEDGPE